MADVGGGEDLDDDSFPFIGRRIEQMFCFVIGDPVCWGLGWLFTSLETVLLGFMFKR